MIDDEEARQIALRYLAQLEAEERNVANLRKDLSLREREILGLEPNEESATRLVLLEDATISGDFGWVFFYESKAYVDSGEFSEKLAGNAPVIVSRPDGNLHVTGTAHPIDVYIENFTRTGDPHRHGPSE